MDPLKVHKNGKIFLLLDTEIGAVGHIASMAILPAGTLLKILRIFQFTCVLLAGNRRLKRLQFQRAIKP